MRRRNRWFMYPPVEVHWAKVANSAFAGTNRTEAWGGILTITFNDYVLNEQGGFRHLETEINFRIHQRIYAHTPGVGVVGEIHLWPYPDRPAYEVFEWSMYWHSHLFTGLCKWLSEHGFKYASYKYDQNAEADSFWEEGTLFGFRNEIYS